MKKVYLVGAGPGSPGLITLKGFELLKQADVIIYDNLVDKRLLEYAREGAELICREDGSKIMIKRAKEGKRVVRLKNGDPAIFGRLSQELELLRKNRIGFEIVPGVTAASAVSAYTGVPLTDRRFSSSVVFVTGHEDGEKKGSLIDWENISKCGTLVLYMSVKNLSEIIETLYRTGWPGNTPVIAVSNAGGINQKVVKGTLRDIAGKKEIVAPAVIIVGEVVRLEKDFNWFRKSKKVLFTGLSKERFFTDKTYIHLPMIKIVRLEDYSEFDNYLKRIKDFHWIVFTSRYGVWYFFERLYTLGYDSRILNNIKIAAIGGSTKMKLQEFGIIADLVPKRESSEGLLCEFKNIEINQKRVFLPRSDISDKGIEDGLKRLGALVTACIAYRNVMPDALPDIDINSFDEIIFTSPSGVRNFIKRYGIPRRVKISCIGDVTRKEVERWSLEG